MKPTETFLFTLHNIYSQTHPVKTQNSTFVGSLPVQPLIERGETKAKRIDAAIRRKEVVPVLLIPVT